MSILHLAAEALVCWPFGRHAAALQLSLGIMLTGSCPESVCLSGIVSHS